jgi:hypothetical protein
MPDGHEHGCRCRHCFGLAEYMDGLTGRDYGLPRAPGHAPLADVSDTSRQLAATRRPDPPATPRVDDVDGVAAFHRRLVGELRRLESVA